MVVPYSSKFHEPVCRTSTHSAAKPSAAARAGLAAIILSIRSGPSSQERQLANPTIKASVRSAGLRRADACCS